MTKIKNVTEEKEKKKLKSLIEFLSANKWHPTPVLLPGKSHGWRSLVGCSPWGRQSRTQLSYFTFTFTFHFRALQKEMATHSSVLVWRIPGTGEPGGLPSMGLYRVGHDWSNLAAAAARQCYVFFCLVGIFLCLTTLNLTRNITHFFDTYRNVSVRGKCKEQMLRLLKILFPNFEFKKILVNKKGNKILPMTLF